MAGVIFSIGGGHEGRRRHGLIVGAELGLAAALVVMLGPVTAEGWVQYRSSQGAAVQWPLGVCEVLFMVDGEDVEALDGALEVEVLRGAFDKWNAVECGGLKLVMNDTLSSNVRADGFDEVNSIVFVTDKWRKDHNYVGLTTLTYDKWTGAITDADMEFNFVDFDISMCGEGASGLEEGDYRFIALHETGHLLGLDHPPNPEAVMYSGGAPWCGTGLPYELSADDVEGKCSIYGADYEAACAGGSADHGVEVAEGMGDVIHEDMGAVEDGAEAIEPPKRGGGCCSAVVGGGGAAAGWGAGMWFVLVLMAGWWVVARGGMEVRSGFRVRFTRLRCGRRGLRRGLRGVGE